MHVLRFTYIQAKKVENLVWVILYFLKNDGFFCFHKWYTVIHAKYFMLPLLCKYWPEIVLTLSFSLGAKSGLTTAYRNEYKFGHLCRCFRALAFVPVEDVEYAFNLLIKSDKYDQRLNPYCIYFKVSVS